MHFVRHGTCKHESECRFVHDLGRVQLCRAALRGACERGEACPLSHDRDVERAPECPRFLLGRCVSAALCPFAHVKKASLAPECPEFSNSYCVRGRRCPLRHLPPPGEANKRKIQEISDRIPESTTEDEGKNEDEILAAAWEAGKRMQMFM
jgi:hypothetical protein